MRLSELEPVLRSGTLRFRCPCGEHSIRVWPGPLAPVGSPAIEGTNGWHVCGTLPDLTVFPSVDLRGHSPCGRHFSIVHGEIEDA